MPAGDRVEIVEVSARDGIQNDDVMLTTQQKVEMITRAVDAGLRRLEVASFVNPERVPQMADAEAVIAALPDRDGVTYIGLVLNRRGFERAQAAGLSEINCVAVCTDTFGRKNQGATVDEAVAAFADIAGWAHDAGIRPTVTLSTAFGCPYEGEVSVEQVAGVVGRCAQAGAAEIALADTIGVAVPSDVTARVDAARNAVDQAGTGATLRCHFHNTRNTGIANAAAAVQAGIRVLDSSLGGIGGCPFAPNATGNIPTEDLAYMLDRMGFHTGIDLARATAFVEWMETDLLGRRVPGLLAKAGLFPG